METKFQTSFIPKRPLVSDQKIHTVHTGTSVIMIIAIVLFLASIAGAVFSIVWENVLNNQQSSYKTQLADSEKRFNTSLIEELKRVNTKIDTGKKLLANHLAVSEIFSIIGKLTIDGVKFNSFSFSAPAKSDDGVKVTMSGVANSFSAIAYQSDVFGQSQKFGTNKVLKNPVLSDLNLDANGNVGFTFNTMINPSDLSYEKVLGDTLDNENTNQSQ